MLELLWPVQDPVESERGLRVLLADLRATLGGSAATIAGRGPMIGLGPALALSLDAETFETAALQALAQSERDALQRAAALYTGPYLPDRATEPWALARRTHLGQLHEQVLARLADHEEERDPAAAERRLRALLHADPTAEPTARRLMALLDRQGRRAEALAVVDALAAALATQLGLAPTAETAALRDRLHGAQPAPTGSAQQPAGGSEQLGPAAAPQPRPTNLPAPLTSFIGRERETAELGRLLLQPPAAGRLVTLTGAGGCGKTRLATEVARTLVPHFPDGVWLVELATLTDPALVPQALATVLGVQERAQAAESQTLTDLVLQALQRHRTLVLLDNCEHLRAAAATLATALTEACPQVQVLATSRQALGIVGEITWLVPSLATPPPPGARTGALIEPEQVARFGAVRLFLERARASRPGFTLSEGNAEPVAQVCRRLDGIPLAIELAAAQLRALHIHDLANRLDDRFRLLSTGSRAALPRHRTLQAVMDWSYSLLDEPERLVMQRLSVFAGGCTLEAAAAVCSDNPGIVAGTPDAVSGWDVVHTAHVAPLLEQLVAKSLVQQAQPIDGDTPRYSLLETVRQYAWQQLLATGPVEAMRIQRHLRNWCLALAEVAAPALVGPDQRRWLAQLQLEHDNLRAALRWTFDSGEVEEGLRLARALWRFWFVRGYLREGRFWLDRGLSLVDAGADVSPTAYANSLRAAGVFACNQGDLAHAISLFERCLALARKLQDQVSIANALSDLGTGLFDRGDHRQAATFHAESLAIRRTLGDPRSVAISLNNLGNVWTAQREYARATACYEESLALKRQLGDRWGVALTLSNLGLLARKQRDFAGADAYYRQSLPLLLAMDDKVGIAGCLEGMGETAWGKEDAIRSVQLLAAAATIRKDIDAPLLPNDRVDVDRILAAARVQLGDQGFLVAWSAGERLSANEVADESTALW